MADRMCGPTRERAEAEQSPVERRRAERERRQKGDGWQAQGWTDAIPAGALYRRGWDTTGRSGFRMRRVFQMAMDLCAPVKVRRTSVSPGSVCFCVPRRSQSSPAQVFSGRGSGRMTARVTRVPCRLRGAGERARMQNRGDKVHQPALLTGALLLLERALIRIPGSLRASAWAGLDARLLLATGTLERPRATRTVRRFRHAGSLAPARSIPLRW